MPGHFIVYGMVFKPTSDYSDAMDFPDKRHNMECEPWQSVLTTASKSQVRSYSLVLDSRAIPCCIETYGTGWQLLVPEQLLINAQQELLLYENANRNWPPATPASRQLTENTLPTISILLLLAIFHNLSLLGLSLPERGIIDLKELGTAHAENIVSGQWWMTVTALTLHADLPHLLGNLTIGGIFIILLCRELGSGLAWTLLLASGAFGNLLNAWLQSPDHRSVGASTAVFGAVGILAAISAVRYRNQLRQRWFVPVAAGLALLAILGTEGKQTDLGAHLFGFVTGICFGVSAELLVGKYGRPGAALNLILALSSGAIVLLSWWTALQ